MQRRDVATIQQCLAQGMPRQQCAGGGCCLQGITVAVGVSSTSATIEIAIVTARAVRVAAVMRGGGGGAAAREAWRQRHTASKVGGGGGYRQRQWCRFGASHGCGAPSIDACSQHRQNTKCECLTELHLMGTSRGQQTSDGAGGWGVDGRFGHTCNQNTPAQMLALHGKSKPQKQLPRHLCRRKGPCGEQGRGTTSMNCRQRTKCDDKGCGCNAKEGIDEGEPEVV